MEPPPPPPPPHGSNPHGGRSGGLPDGKYDIFVIPPTSSGSGFLYLPSLQVQRNSFLAGVFCTVATFFVYSIAVPVIKEWFNNTLHGGGSGLWVIVVVVAVASWAFGKTQGEGTQPTGSGKGGNAGGSTFNANTGSQSQSQQQPNGSAYGSPPPQSPPGAGPTPKSSWQRPPPQANTTGGTAGAKTAWEKAREETRKREEEKRKAEELRKRREELEKERQKQREKDLLERLEREKKEKEKAEAATKEKEAKEREKAREKEKFSSQRPPMPSARTENDDDAYSFRPYDRPRTHNKTGSGASVYSESSYAASQSTAKTTPPPSTRGPYSTKDPDKIIIKGVYSFNNAFMRTPISQLVSGSGAVTDGLILRITTEGLFIDDDVRGVPQREWDVKAWTMKLAESCEIGPVHVLRASVRDQEGKKYVFILSKTEGWKVAVGLQRLRRGSQVRSLGVAGLPQNEAKVILESLGYI